MKLFLISSLLLLVPLAFAEPATPPEIKMLFADGVVLTESFDARQIRYLYHGDSFHIYTLSNASKWFSQMEFKKDLMRQNDGFVVEIRPRGPNFDESDDLCRKQSNDDFKHMIVSCFGDVTTRHMGNDEMAQIIEYQNEQRATKKPFEVIYDHKQTITRSRDIEALYFADITKIVKDHVLNVYAKINPGEEFHEMQISDKLVDRSFVIEGLPAKSEEGCGKEGLKDLHMVSCKGKIKIRPN